MFAPAFVMLNIQYGLLIWARILGVRIKCKNHLMRFLRKIRIDTWYMRNTDATANTLVADSNFFLSLVLSWNWQYFSTFKRNWKRCAWNKNLKIKQGKIFRLRWCWYAGKSALYEAKKKSQISSFRYSVKQRLTDNHYVRFGDFSFGSKRPTRQENTEHRIERVNKQQSMIHKQVSDNKWMR